MNETAAPFAGDEARVPATVRVGGHDLPSWPKDHGTSMVCGAQIVATRFPDHETYHPALIDSVLASERDMRFRSDAHAGIRGGCGNKVYDIPGWNTPAAQLIHGRAMMFAFHSSRGAVFADDTWASVYRDGDYCLAHSHTRCDYSIVYVLDPGDPDPRDPFAGQLCFMDPRIDWCCPMEPGRATRPVMPQMLAGTMLLFSSAYLHSVNPYHGARPRITMSWNVAKQRIPGAPREWAERAKAEADRRAAAAKA
ncbi:MAG: putative 2OG-Fe(II) oxygenase [Burkholderiales bacterium]